MRTIKVRAFLEIGLANARHKDIIDVEVEETDSPEQIEATIDMQVKEWMYGYVDYGWEEIPQ